MAKATLEHLLYYVSVFALTRSSGGEGDAQPLSFFALHREGGDMQGERVGRIVVPPKAIWEWVKTCRLLFYIHQTHYIPQKSPSSTNKKTKDSISRFLFLMRNFRDWLN